MSTYVLPIPPDVRASLDRADVSTSAERARAGRRSGTESDAGRRRRPLRNPKRVPQRKRKERKPAPPDVDPLRQ